MELSAEEKKSIVKGAIAGLLGSVVYLFYALVVLPVILTTILNAVRSGELASTTASLVSLAAFVTLPLVSGALGFLVGKFNPKFGIYVSLGCWIFIWLFDYLIEQKGFTAGPGGGIVLGAALSYYLFYYRYKKREEAKGNKPRS